MFCGWALCCPVRPLLSATGESIPLRGLEGVPGLPGAPQDEAGLTRKFETSHVAFSTIKLALTGIIDVEVIADGVSGSGQSFSTEQDSKGPNHRT